MKKVYLAGPEVFLKDSIEIGAKKKELCDKYGFIGLYPLDNEIDMNGVSKETMGLEISRANEALILSADAVIANLTPFRGASADVGTVYEVGMAKGLRKVILGYTHDERKFLQRNIDELNRVCVSEGQYRDHNDMAIEDFNLVDNLMIDGGVTYPIIKREVSNVDEMYRSLAAFEECLVQLHRHYYPRGYVA
ncbi:nucleoside 2-deoxyribosyltransferase [Vibrio aestuarianus]|uniref:Nucleoside 2-deoxyribosyltransferase n=2 Tax=Vibrio TaxID=662 RepID=A0A9X4IYC2_9VIBR|nr:MULTISPECIES: nucleoside 2-deoxyribosyltransferase [Vibrio]ASG03776.1 nucleoside 2-deoxyribosyltransferase [Vibrio anguillarum]EGQ9302259.1 nucleoside 2-deoxyribosyltransferase [Vibrio vulnificus]EIJ0985187.1 nucleoside 2-deoxyribosyltransferase [Vibrio vulnificus]EIO3969995.1 nucleoside 2-deoxyribosyltransferase [Vibrio vulnificus]MBT2919619.1 nucleoside 2-deoxyribosyltransferase [Vibrio anguillarum]